MQGLACVGYARERWHQWMNERLARHVRPSRWRRRRGVSVGPCYGAPLVCAHAHGSERVSVLPCRGTRATHTAEPRATAQVGCGTSRAALAGGVWCARTPGVSRMTDVGTRAPQTWRARCAHRGRWLRRSHVCVAGRAVRADARWSGCAGVLGVPRGCGVPPSPLRCVCARARARVRVRACVCVCARMCARARVCVWGEMRCAPCVCVRTRG